MKWISDKQLFKAVMFALDMCGHDLQTARDEKIDIAAKYYNVNKDEVFKIVREELWRLKRKKILEGKKDSFETIFNPHGIKLLGTGFGNDFIFICPKCFYVQACNVHDDYNCDLIFVRPCPICGFTDDGQRNVTRKQIFEYAKEKGLI